MNNKQLPKPLNDDNDESDILSNMFEFFDWLGYDVSSMPLVKRDYALY